MHNTLIDSKKLLTIIDEPNTLVFDCRHDLTNREYGITSYRKGHLPKAIFACMENDLSKKPDGTNGRHPLPDANLFSDWLNQCGVTVLPKSLHMTMLEVFMHLDYGGC